jgi:hypothetical protein
MSNRLVLTLICIALCECAEAQPSTQNPFADPASFVGQYPFDVISPSGLETRLRRLLGGAYEEFDQAFNGPQSPITMESTGGGESSVRRRFLIMEGCMAHNCSEVNALVVVEADANTLYVALNRNGQITTYSEHPGQRVEACRWASFLQRASP